MTDRCIHQRIENLSLFYIVDVAQHAVFLRERSVCLKYSVELRNFLFLDFLSMLDRCMAAVGKINIYALDEIRNVFSRMMP